MIRVPCPRCQNAVEVEDDRRGRTDRCPHCATTLSIPKLAIPSRASLTLRRVDTSLAPSGDVPLAQYLNKLSLVVLQSDVFAAKDLTGEFTITISFKSPGQVSFAATTSPPELMPDTVSLSYLLAGLFAVPEPPLHITYFDYRLSFVIGNE